VRIKQVKKESNKSLLVLEDGTNLILPFVIEEKGILNEDEKMSGKVLINADNADYLNVKDCAFRLLGRRAHSVFELRTKLIKRKFNRQLINKVIEELIDLKLLDDRKFTEEFYNFKIIRKSDGLNKIIHQLKQKGIENSTINEIVRAKDDADIHLQNAVKLATYKLQSIKKNVDDKIKIKAKLNLYLQNKGFSVDIIQQALTMVKL
jgi:regulatory protein